MKKIPEIVRYEARQQIPFNLEDVVWDYQTISPPATGPREVEVGIFAMKRDIVADYVSDFLAMKIEPDIVQMAPVALYNFLRYDKKEGGGATILIDVGAENTNLVIADGERVWIRNVPLGGNNFTQALAKEFKLTFSKAENLKRHAAESKHARQVFQAMRQVFGDLLTEVQRSIGYYTSLHRDARIERVVAMGNAFRLAGLSKFLSQNLGVDVARIENLTSLSDAEALSAPLFKENVLSFGVAFGLAIQGLGLASIQTSLLPPEILSAKVMRRKRPYLAVAGAAVIGAVGAFAYDQVATEHEVEGSSPLVVQSMVDTVKQLASENTAQKAKFDEQKEALKVQQGKLAEIQALVGDDSYAYQVLRTLWDVWPYDEKVETYKVETNVPAWSTLGVVEMLNLSAVYVGDIRTIGAPAKGDASAAAPTAGGAPATATPAVTVVGYPEGAVPALYIEVEGITSRRGTEGYEWLNAQLAAKLKATCKRTLELQTPEGTKVLAEIPLWGQFNTESAYAEYAAPASAAAPVVPGVPVAPKVATLDRGNDFWFKLQWAVGIGPLREDQRKAVYLEIVTFAKPGPEDAQKTPEERTKTRIAELAAKTKDESVREMGDLAKSWLVTRDTLAKIAEEGVVKDWPKEAAAPK
jgi:type IV pilus assembly protein PilM